MNPNFVTIAELSKSVKNLPEEEETDKGQCSEIATALGWLNAPLAGTRKTED